MANTTRVAVAQASSTIFDRDACVETAQRLIHQAAAAGARLVVLPEAFISGYPRGISFGAVMGERAPHGRDQYLQYWESAVEVPGPVTEILGQAAAAQRINVVVGVIERSASTLYCTVVFLGSDGQYLGKHRKVQPTGTERLVWGCGDGSTLTVVETDVGRVGAVICWENYMPLLRYTMYSKGVQIYCAPTADGRDTWLASMRHIACEGRCYVLSANQYTTANAYSVGYQADQGIDPDDISSRGGSVIISPLGEVIAGPSYDREEVITADICLEDIVRAKYDFDVAGHYSRSDIFRLTVDESPAPPLWTSHANLIRATSRLNTAEGTAHRGEGISNC